MRFFLFLVMCIIAGCADQTIFKGSNNPGPEKKTGNSTIGGSISVSTPSSESLFATKDKSLDAYFLIDVSGSLEEKDTPCLRYDALAKFRKNLVNIMGSNGDLRATLITFSDRAKFEFIDTDFLQISEQDFYQKYRRIICKHAGNTNTKDGIDLTIKTAQDVIGRLGAKEQRSLLFFTDGEPRVDKGSFYYFNQVQLYESAVELKKLFPNRIFSLLLGDGQTDPNPNNVLETVTPLDFLNFLSSAPNSFAQAQFNGDVESAINKFLGL